MRTEKEMLDLVINTARDDDRIRAVILNGSRANPNAPPDPFQDYDIVYIVTDPLPFRKNMEWIAGFGERMILQIPEDMQDPPQVEDSRFTYLMQFMDGNRIDLSICPLVLLDDVLKDSLTIILLDKDDLIPLLNPPTERDYFPKPPTTRAFDDCCNEFWWVSIYVAKGLWRSEILYALKFYESTLRVELMKMLTWLVGVKTDFRSNPGKYGKYMQQYLPAEMWDLLLKTYPGANSDEIWAAFFVMCDLFRYAARQVADHFKYTYPLGDDRRVTAFLRHVWEMPPGADEI
ncbi:aminoglycoside 6-adenylyltransferase [Chloroflexota bacterium]